MAFRPHLKRKVLYKYEVQRIPTRGTVEIEPTIWRIFRVTFASSYFSVFSPQIVQLKKSWHSWIFFRLQCFICNSIRQWCFVWQHMGECLYELVEGLSVHRLSFLIVYVVSLYPLLQGIAVHLLTAMHHASLQRVLLEHTSSRSFLTFLRLYKEFFQPWSQEQLFKNPSQWWESPQKPPRQGRGLKGMKVKSKRWITNVHLCTALDSSFKVSRVVLERTQRIP